MATHWGYGKGPKHRKGGRRGKRGVSVRRLTVDSFDAFLLGRVVVDMLEQHRHEIYENLLDFAETLPEEERIAVIFHLHPE